MSRILLVPSIWMEAFGRVVVEAQLNGIPVIASDKGNLPNTVGEGGLIIDNSNSDGWIYAITKLYFDTSFHFQLSQNALENINRYNSDILYNSFSNQVKEIIEGKALNPDNFKKGSNYYLKVSKDSLGVISITREMFEFDEYRYINF